MDVEQRLNKIEEKHEALKNKVNEMDKDTAVFKEKFQASLDRFSEAVDNFTETLKTFAKKDDVEQLEKSVKEIDNKSKIDILEVIKQYALSILLSGGAIYFILELTGKIK